MGFEALKAPGHPGAALAATPHAPDRLAFPTVSALAVAGVLAFFIVPVEWAGSPGPGLHGYTVAGGATAIALTLAAAVGRRAERTGLANAVAVIGAFAATVLAHLTDVPGVTGTVLRPAEVMPLILTAVVLAHPVWAALLAVSTWLALAVIGRSEADLPAHLVMQSAAGALAVALSFALRRGRLTAAAQARLEAERAHLDRQRDSVRRFVRHAAHQMRTPLTPLRLMSTVWRDRLDDPEAREEMLRQLDRRVLRLATVVDSLVALAAAEETATGTRTDLGETVRRAAAVDGRIVVEAPEEAYVALSFRGVEAVVKTLVDNAREVASSRMAVRLHQDGRSWVVDVEDDGPGIPPDQRDALREPFGKIGVETHAATGSSGLGLAMVDAIMVAADGSFELLDSPLGGLRARIRLPAA